MSKNIIQEIQRHSSSKINKKYKNNSQEFINTKSFSRYRTQLALQSLEYNEKDRSMKMKQKFRSFGEDQFMQKLKINSTKHIDRKSVKAIQKYLNQLSQQKRESQLYVPRTTSLKSLQQYFLKENKKLISNDSIKNVKIYSQNSIMINDRQNFNEQINNEEDKESIIQSQKREWQNESNKIYGSAKFNNKMPSPNDRKLQHNQTDKNYIEGISFRNNSYVLFENDIQNKRKSSSKELIKNTEYNNLSGNENFYEQKQRPTIDSEVKIQARPSYNDIKKKPNVSLDHQQLDKEILKLKHQNQQQAQIIRLQQVMIQKLNVQLQSALIKIVQIQKEKEEKEKQYISSIQKFNTNIFQSDFCNEQNINHPNYMINEAAQKSFFQNVQKNDRKWEEEYEKLKQLLTSMSHQPLQNPNIDEYDPYQMEQNQNVFHQNYYQSNNQFYYKPDSQMSSETRLRQLKISDETEFVQNLANGQKPFQKHYMYHQNLSRQKGILKI